MSPHVPFDDTEKVFNRIEEWTVGGKEDRNYSNRAKVISNSWMAMDSSAIHDPY